jgi:hypothetical protein
MQTLFATCVLLAALQSNRANEAALVPAQECDSDSAQIFQYGPDCYAATAYDTAFGARRAAQQGLKDAMIASTGITCGDDNCRAGSCISKVRCQDPVCEALTIEGPVMDEITGLYDCTACWGPGAFQVNCSPCVPR